MMRPCGYLSGQITNSRGAQQLPRFACRSLTARAAAHSPRLESSPGRGILLRVAG